MHQKEKIKKFRVCSAGFSILKAGGFSCRLYVLFGELGINLLLFLFKKYMIFFQFVNFFFLVIKSLDPDPKMLDPDPHRN
jgi:hypothetical protein